MLEGNVVIFSVCNTSPGPNGDKEGEVSVSFKKRPSGKWVRSITLYTDDPNKMNGEAVYAAFKAKAEAVEYFRSLGHRLISNPPPPYCQAYTPHLWAKFK
jgi:hypothetical protein